MKHIVPFQFESLVLVEDALSLLPLSVTVTVTVNIIVCCDGVKQNRLCDTSQLLALIPSCVLLLGTGSRRL